MWLRMREIKVQKNAPGVMFYKYSHNPDVEYYSIDLRKKLKGPSPNFENVELPILYPNGHLLSSPKLKDIKVLLAYVPHVYHDFYNTLKSDESLASDDIDGLPQVADFEPFSE